MDDSFSEDTRISSITGVLVPFNLYAETRSKFYEIVPREEGILPDGKKFINIQPPELHGSDFLTNFPDADDSLRFKTFDGIVDLINSQQLEIYRVGYYITEDVKSLFDKFSSDPKLQGLCWFSIISILESKLADEIIVPVMDGFSPSSVRAFSEIVKNMDFMRAAGWENIMSLKNTENIFGEVLYSDSKYSIFIQIADLVSYLRHVADFSREGLELTSFKQQLLHISEKLSPSIEVENIIR